MEILIISGLSGGGKSKAASFLEDMGFYIVDNMPAGMILKFAEFCAASSTTLLSKVSPPKMGVSSPIEAASFTIWVE